MTITDKSCLIMDEVDGMSAGDRGGVGALCALIKKTKVFPPRYCLLVSVALSCVDGRQIPIICIANDRGAQKLKPLTNVTFNLSYRRYVSHLDSGARESLIAF